MGTLDKFPGPTPRFMRLQAALGRLYDSLRSVTPPDASKDEYYNSKSAQAWTIHPRDTNSDLAITRDRLADNAHVQNTRCAVHRPGTTKADECYLREWNTNVR